MATTARTIRRKGSRLQVIYDLDTWKVEFTVWESPTGELVLVDDDRMSKQKAAGTDPIRRLLKTYPKRLDGPAPSQGES